MRTFNGWGSKIASFGMSIIANLKGQRDVTLLRDSVRVDEYERLKKDGILPAVIIRKRDGYNSASSRELREEITSLYQESPKYFLSLEHVFFLQARKFINMRFGDYVSASPLHISSVMENNGTKRLVDRVEYTKFEGVSDVPARIVYKTKETEDAYDFIYDVADAYVKSIKEADSPVGRGALVKKQGNYI